MTEDAGSGRPAYNRPRRYVAAAPADRAPGPPSVDPAVTAEVTRQHPSFDDAAALYGRRSTDGPTPAPPGPGIGPGPGPGIGPEPSPPYPVTYPTGHPPAAVAHPPGRSRTPSTRVLVVAAAVVVALAVVIGLVVGLNGSDDSQTAGGVPTVPTAVPTTAAPTTATTAADSTPADSTSTSATEPPVPATALCSNLGDTAPVSSLVVRPRPAQQMPVSYVEPRSGARFAVCVGYFRPGGTGRGRLAYLAEYRRLAAAQYVVTLKTLGWVLVPNLPSPTYRNALHTTVTLVQRGTSLVTVVGDGT